MQDIPSLSLSLFLSLDIAKMYLQLRRATIEGEYDHLEIKSIRNE